MDALYDDFNKYEDEGVAADILRVILRFVLIRVCSQASFSKNTIPGLDAKIIQKGLGILADAGLVKIVYSSNCSSLPIASGINFKRMKLLFADTGLYLSASGLDVSQFALETDFKELNIGNVCELSVGLELINALDAHVKPEIFFLDKGFRCFESAKVDFVIQKGSAIVPIEVKARTQGGMKSLWAFLEKKSSDYVVRCSLESFSKMDRVVVYPLYAAGNLLK